MSNATFCYWCLKGENHWKQVPPMQSNDGSLELLELLTAGPFAYKAWAEEYFDVPVTIEVVVAVYAHGPLDWDLIKALNCEAELIDVYADASEIGYPKF
jgi:hypothetical protein